MPKKWTICEPLPEAASLAERLRTSPMIAQMLLNRGITDVEAGQNFLRPNLKLLHDPALLPGATRAAGRIAQAIAKRQRIAIYGDYDVDGITATSILWHAIKLLGGQVEYYIPHRVDEGYGLNAAAVEQLCQNGVELIITVDCGITALEPAAVAAAHGIDLIITDHHEWKERGDADRDEDAHVQGRPVLPTSYAVVHPRLVEDGPAYPNENLCGAGVAFKLAWAIGRAVAGSERVSEPFKAFLVDALALAALGTIADVVPLIGENRILAHFGLGGLKQSRLIGLVALIASAGLDGQDISAYDVGFRLGPRLNACGRMGHARLAVEMFTVADATRAAEIATFLEQQNRERQTMEKKIVAQAIEQAESLGASSADCHAVVVGGAGWHPGVIGIVASRLVDKFAKPAIVVALGATCETSEDHLAAPLLLKTDIASNETVDETADANPRLERATKFPSPETALAHDPSPEPPLGAGSCRSIPGFHIARALTACAEYLVTFGGHEMAAGLKVRSDQFENFRKAFQEYARSVITSEMLVPELRVDTLADLRHVTEAFVNDLKRLGPFGNGNRKPLLACRGLQLSSAPRRVGKTGDHLQLFIRQGNRSMKAIAFGAGNLADTLREGDMIDLAVEPQLNAFNGRVIVELEVKDFLLKV